MLCCFGDIPHPLPKGENGPGMDPARNFSALTKERGSTIKKGLG